MLNDDFIDDIELLFYINYFNKKIDNKLVRKNLYKLLIQKEPFIKFKPKDFTERVKGFLQFLKLVEKDDFTLMITSS